MSETERELARQDREIQSLRSKVHTHSNEITALKNEQAGSRLTALEAFKNKAIGVAMAVGTLAGLIGGLIAKALER